MKKRTYLIVGLLLCFSAVVASARLFYRQDIQFGTQHSTTSDGLPLDAVNASVIPLTTGSNVEAVLNSLQAQITALQAQLALKAPAANPAFTGYVTLPTTTTIGSVTAAQIGYVAGATSSLQEQIALKANAANPAFTGNGTISGEWTALQFNTTGGDNTHYVHLGNSADPTVPATDNAGILQYNTTLAKWRFYNGSAWDNLAVEP